MPLIPVLGRQKQVNLCEFDICGNRPQKLKVDFKAVTYNTLLYTVKKSAICRLPLREWDTKYMNTDLLWPQAMALCYNSIGLVRILNSKFKSPFSRWDMHSWSLSSTGSFVMLSLFFFSFPFPSFLPPPPSLPHYFSLQFIMILFGYTLLHCVSFLAISPMRVRTTCFCL